MTRFGPFFIVGIGGVVVAVSIGANRPSWIGVGIVYLLAAATVLYRRRISTMLQFHHGVGTFIAAILLTAVINGIWIASQYSSFSLGFWDVLLGDILRTVMVAAAIPTGLSTNRWHYLVSVLPIPLLIGVRIAETVRSSMPYDGELTIAVHLWLLLMYNIHILVESLIFALPLFVLLHGVPTTVERWLTVDVDG